MARRKRRLPKKLPVVWTTDDGTVVEYVPRIASELRPEFERVREHGLRAARVLSRLKRHKNIILVSARFELEHCHQAPPEGAGDEWYAREIARLSYVYEQTHQLLSRLVNSRIQFIENARFLLTYGQTPTKREPATSYSKPQDDEEE